jgi:class 3 adenylate cyclase
MATLASTYNSRRYPSRGLPWGALERAQEPEPAELLAAQAQAVSAPVPSRSFRLPSLNLRPFLFATVNGFHRSIQWSLLAAMGICLALFGLQFPHSLQWDRLWLVLQLHEFVDPLLASLAAVTRSRWPDPDSVNYLPLGLAVGVWMARRASRAVLLPLVNALRPNESEGEKVRRSAVFVEDDAGNLAIESEQSRESLLRRYRAIDSALKSTKRVHCAFLSIDVAGSTRMKESEEELPVSITFRAYMNMLEEIFHQHNAWKEAWTPDGVMVCFPQLDMAVAAAQTVLHRLRTFNRTENLLKTRISVRCGVNEGRVPMFEDTKLEKLAHQVLDLTGHLQKHANPNTLWLSDEAWKQLKDKSGFMPTDRNVDGYRVFQWSPSLAFPDEPVSIPGSREKQGNSDPTWY